MAIDMQNEINSFLRQRVDEECTVEQAKALLLQLHVKAQRQPAPPPAAPSNPKRG
jgi:hypothetical protein